MNLPGVFIEAFFAASATAVVAGFVTAISMLMKMTKAVNRLVKMDEHRATDLEAIAKVQRPMLVGVKVSLEALRDGECNGNVTDAHGEISGAISGYDDYLASLVRRGR